MSLLLLVERSLRPAHGAAGGIAHPLSQTRAGAAINRRREQLRPLQLPLQNWFPNGRRIPM
jgi:hypothetical protein